MCMRIYIYTYIPPKGRKDIKRKSIRRRQDKEEIERHQQGRRQEKRIKQGSTKSERRTQTSGTRLGQNDEDVPEMIEGQSWTKAWRRHW